MEDILNQPAETTEVEVDETLNEGTSEVAGTSNEVEFTNSDNEEVEEKVNKPQKTNADYARERRKAEHEKALKQARNEAIIIATERSS